MTGIEKITGRLKSDAQAEIDGILGEARAEARRITEGYEAQARKEAAELDARNGKAAAERGERLVSAAQMEARKTVLAAKQAGIERAYERALEKLCSLPEQQYTEALADLLLEAAPAGRGEVLFSEKDRAGVGAAAVELANSKGGGKLTLSAETQPIPGGFLLRDGNVEVNCSFDTLVRLQKTETAGAVARLLFG